jgi:ParB family transcriptional regulator, chromosome partitioning protein
MTQEQIAQRVGKARATVANALRLLDLPAKVQQMLSRGDLQSGHAKALLGLEIAKEQEILALRVAKEGLSVRQVEHIVGRLNKPAKKGRAEKVDIPASHLQYLTDKLHQHLGTSVRVKACRTLANGKKAKGTIEIDYFSNDDLDRLLVLLGLADNL